MRGRNSRRNIFSLPSLIRVCCCKRSISTVMASSLSLGFLPFGQTSTRREGKMASRAYYGHLLGPCLAANGSHRGSVSGLAARDCDLMAKSAKLARSARMCAAPCNAVNRPKEKMILCTSLSTPSITVDTELRDAEAEKKNPRSVVAVILGGGAGTRLFPLTKRRAKPAVPIGGAYRLIDVPMSNCINSGINKVYILTQFNSASLNRHLGRAYNFGSGINFGDGFVEVLAATQTPGEAGMKWFQGTADAVRQFHWLFEDAKGKEIEDVLILSGDHLYRMDYMEFVQNHRQSGADITIACLPMDDSRASDFGLMKIDSKGRVVAFSEKPKGEELKAMEVDTTVLGLPREEARKKPYIASMGIYVFKKEILLNLLRWRFPTANDFGSEIIPASAREFYIKAYLFNDYWEDIGTIKSFFQANLALTAHPPEFSFYDAHKPMYTSPRNLPPTKIDNSKVVDSIVSHGSFLDHCLIEHSVVGIRSRINHNVHLKDTVMLGADYYETEAEVQSLLAEGRVPIGIGANTEIRNCIIDKNARIGKNVSILNSEGIQEADRSSEGFYIRSGITIILKNSTIKDGFVI